MNSKSKLIAYFSLCLLMSTPVAKPEGFWDCLFGSATPEQAPAPAPVIVVPPTFLQRANDFSKKHVTSISVKVNPKAATLATAVGVAGVAGYVYRNELKNAYNTVEQNHPNAVRYAKYTLAAAAALASTYAAYRSGMLPAAFDVVVKNKKAVGATVVGLTALGGASYVTLSGISSKPVALTEDQQKKFDSLAKEFENLKATAEAASAAYAFKGALQTENTDLSKEALAALDTFAQAFVTWFGEKSDENAQKMNAAQDAFLILAVMVPAVQ